MRTIVCVLILLVGCDADGPKNGPEVAPADIDEVQVDVPVIETGCTTCECTPGATESCGVERPPWCKAGTRVCSPDGKWEGECLGEVPPAPRDTCEPGNDANCNNVPNEGCPCIDGEERCGPCGDGTMTCVGGVRGECLGATPASTACGPCGDGVSTCGGACIGANLATAACGPCNDGVSTCGGPCEGGTPQTAACGACGQGTSTCGGPCVGDPPATERCGPCNDGVRTCGGPCQGGTPLTAACGPCGQGVSTCGGPCVGDTQQTVTCGPCGQGRSTCGGPCIGDPPQSVACGACGRGVSTCGGPCVGDLPQTAACGPCGMGTSTCGGPCVGDPPQSAPCGTCEQGTKTCGGSCVGAPDRADVACGVCLDGNNHCGGGCIGALPSRCPPGWSDRGATCVAETYVLQHIWEISSPLHGYVSGCDPAGTCLQLDIDGNGVLDNLYGANSRGSVTIRYRWTHVQGACSSDDQPALQMDCELRDETLTRRQTGSQQVNNSEFVHGDFGSWCNVFKLNTWSAGLDCIKQLEFWVTAEIPRMPLVALVFVAVLVAACDDPALDALPFACTDDAACGDGWRCVASRCEPVTLSPEHPRCAGVVNGALGGPGCEALLTAGGGTSCLTRVGTGNAHCWGNDEDEVASPRTGVWRVLAPGFHYGCGIDHKGLECWSGSPSERTAVPRVAAVGLAVGDDQACAVDAAGAVVCWGVPGPVLGVPEGLRVSALAVGATHACAIEPGSTLRCWGYADERIAAPAGTWSSIAVVDAYSCALDGRGAVTCWGFHVPPRPDVPLRSIAVGTGFMCGLDFAGQLVCTGDIAAPPAGHYDALVAGRGHACAMVAGSFETRCWGDIVADPVAAPFETIAVEEGAVCGVTTTGSAHCFCLDGACGLAAPDGVFAPVVAMSPGAVCLSQVGQVQCWGDSAVVRASGGAPFIGGQDVIRALVATDTMVCASFAEADTDCWDGTRAGVGFGARRDVVDLASDGAGVCALTATGELLCEGGLTDALLPVPARGTLLEVAIAGGRACGRWADGVACWGGGFELSLPAGEVLLGEMACVLPEGGDMLTCNDQASDNHRYRQVRIRGQTRCGILLNGDVACRVGARRVVFAAGSAE